MRSRPTSTSAKPANPRPELEHTSLDPVRLADRSRRCFVLGMIGALPVLGLPAAVEAARLFCTTARETGEQWKHWPFLAHLILGWILLGAIYPLAGFTLTLGLFVVELGVLAWGFVALVRRTKARVWNPARRWLYSGLALAYGQVFVLGAAGLWLLSQPGGKQ